MPRPASTSTSAAPNAYAFAELGAARAQHAALADECALAMVYNGLNQAVMMVSPHQLEDFAVGFSLGNALVESIDDIYDIQLHGTDERREVHLQVASRAFWAIKQQRRQLAGNSGCGLCGVDALEQALPALTPLPGAPLPAPEHLAGLRQRIAGQQQLAQRSGALHAALFIDDEGEIRLCREDIGRHNALDKLIGGLARERLDCARGFALVTSRCSLELLHKAVRAGIATLVSLSAPTALTVDWARRHQLNLIHLPHHSPARVYSPAPSEEVPRS